MLKKQRNIAIIPLRGGSKRLPRKNVLPLSGQALMLHTITYAKQNSDIIHDIVVSTDNEEIKSIALSHGIRVVDRPEHLSGDHATTVSAMKHVLESTEQEYDNVILFQATNPLRPKGMLKEAYQVYIDTNSDSLMAVSRNEDKLGKIINNRFVPYNYEVGQRSQDLEPLYYENGLLYITKASLILKETILGEQNYPFIVNHPYTKVDIDTLEDFKYAEFIIENYKDE